MHAASTKIKTAARCMDGSCIENSARATPSYSGQASHVVVRAISDYHVGGCSSPPTAFFALMPEAIATPPPAAPPAQRFFNRELSWLEFNQRVLDEARDEGLPLLERLKFLAITASNLDEFFMVRVGGLRVLVEQQIATPDPAGMTPPEQLAAISARVH